MLSKKIYTAEYIQVLHDKTGNDPLLLERVVLAFGLLEAIARVALIKDSPSISASDIGLILNVSARTIERDFDWLNDRSYLMR